MRMLAFRKNELGSRVSLFKDGINILEVTLGILIRYRGKSEDMAAESYSEDSRYIFNSTVTEKAAAAPISLMTKTMDRSKKVEEIKKLVMSGKYRINAEKLAEKILCRTVGEFIVGF